MIYCIGEGESAAFEVFTEFMLMTVDSIVKAGKTNFQIKKNDSSSLLLKSIEVQWHSPAVS